MFVVYETDSGWSGEHMRFAEYDEAVEFMRQMTEREYEVALRWEP